MLLSKLCSRLYQVTCIKISSIFVTNIPSYVQITIMPWIYSVSHGLMHMNTWSPTHSTIGEGPGALLRQAAWLIDTDRLLRVVALYHLQLQFSVCWQLLRCDKSSPVPAMIDRKPILLSSLPCYYGLSPQNCEPKPVFSFWSCFCRLFCYSDKE